MRLVTSGEGYDRLAFPSQFCIRILANRGGAQKHENLEDQLHSHMLDTCAQFIFSAKAADHIYKKQLDLRGFLYSLTSGVYAKIETNAKHITWKALEKHSYTTARVNENYARCMCVEKRDKKTAATRDLRWM